MTINSTLKLDEDRVLTAIDIDDVKGDFVGGFVAWHNERYGTKLHYDGWHSYQFEEVIGGTHADVIAKVRLFYETHHFTNMPLIDGAKEGITQLYKTSDLVAVTGRNPMAENSTKRWLARHFPEVPDVYFTDAFERNRHNKSEVCLRLGAQEIVEDNRNNAIECAKAGIGAVLITRPWNQGDLPKRIIRVSGWAEVPSALDELRKYH